MHNRLAHDACHRASVAVVGVFAPLLRGEECKDAYEEVYPLLRRMLREFEEAMEREEKRLRGAT